MRESSSCIANRCYHSVDGLAAVCPRCGSAMWPSRRWRRRGWVLIGVGLTLMAVTLGSFWYLIPLVLSGGESGEALSGESLIAAAALFGFLGLMLAFGIVALLGGVRQARSGRRDPVMTRAAGLLALLFVLACAATAFFGSGALGPAGRIRLP